ncbi:MAG: amidohydrolase [Sporolactobacillus sp.]
MDKERFHQHLIAIFRELHRYPELSSEEFQTTEKIKSWLSERDIRLRPTGLPTGAVAEINGDAQGPIVGLRADIDALPIKEETGLSYQSENVGVMHACGHDLHTTTLLGAAFLLKEQEAQLPGGVRLIFQPAEETDHGGLKIVKDGQLDGLDAIIGTHNKPDLPVGTLGIRTGPLMAACDKFTLVITGIGGHAAIPECSRDVLVAAAAFIQAVQTIVSRSISPKNEAVFSVTSIHGGTTWNVLPEHVTLSGTVRTFEKVDRERAIARTQAILEGIERAYDVQTEMVWGIGTPAVINDPELTAVVRAANERAAKIIVPERCLGGDDFSCLQEAVPGVFVFVGSEGSQDWHHPAFRVDERALENGASFFARTAKAVLAHSAVKANINSANQLS